MNRILANRIVFVLSLGGVLVAGYLTLAHLHYLDLVCGEAHGCDEVAADPSAHGFGIPALSGIPTAAFGLGMYLVMAGLAFVRAATNSARVIEAASRLQWALALTGLLVAGWLTYLEAYKIHAWCRWCVASAVIILLLFLITTAERLGSAMSLKRGESLETIG